MFIHFYSPKLYHAKPKGKTWLDECLLSDIGSCYIASDLKDYLDKCGIRPIHGRICHPQTQGKIERYHRSMKNVVNLDHYYCPDELKEAIAEFVNYYNNQRYHESLDNGRPTFIGVERNRFSNAETRSNSRASKRGEFYMLLKNAT